MRLRRSLLGRSGSAACLVFLLSGAALATDSAEPQIDAPRFGEEICVIGEIPFLEPVEPGQPVTIRFGIGELDIETVAGHEIRAELDVGCREKLSPELCERYRSRLRLEPRRSSDGVEVRLVGLSRWKLHRLRLDGRVTVPTGSPLTVRVGIGEVDIRSEAESLDVRMGIGDLTVRVPGEAVASVEVGTRIGDASVSSPNGFIEGKRPMLVGSRVRWRGGAGTATVSVGLRIGDAKVVLD